MKSINLKTIRIDGGTQSRVEISSEAVADYAEAIRGGAQMPPVVVFHDGADYWLADGFHRFHAHAAADRASIAAEVHAGTQRDAVLHSLGANAVHGLRRTNADKRKAVQTILGDQEWAKWSDHEVARRCGVSHMFVGTVRRSLETVSSEATPTARTYTTKHGTEAVMRTGNIGSAPKAEPSKRTLEPQRPADAHAPADADELAEAHHTITDLAQENERLQDRLAVEAMDASEDEKLAASETIGELRARVVTLEAEVAALKVSRDTYMREAGEAKKSAIYWRKQAEKAAA